MDTKLLIKTIPEIVLTEKDTLLKALNVMNRSSIEIIIVVRKNKFLGVLTSGDAIRAIIKYKHLDVPLSKVYNKKPITISSDESFNEVLRNNNYTKINYIPVVTNFEYEGLIFLSNLRENKFIECPVLIMAGGLGTRLRPLTNDLPKPLLPMNKKPIIQHIIESVRKFGAKTFYIAVNYKKEKIMDFLGDGSWLKVKIEYIEEEKQLGTAGALGSLDTTKFKNIMIINGDILTELNFYKMFNYHQQNENNITIAIKKFEHNVPYGIVDIDYNKINDIVEKPKIAHYINAGIYVIDSKLLADIPHDKHLDMPDFIRSKIDEDFKVQAFQIEEKWLDIGNLDEYNKLINK